jgi:hypothetical protein
MENTQYGNSDTLGGDTARFSEVTNAAGETVGILMRAAGTTAGIFLGASAVFYGIRGVSYLVSKLFLEETGEEAQVKESDGSVSLKLTDKNRDIIATRLWSSPIMIEKLKENIEKLYPQLRHAHADDLDTQFVSWAMRQSASTEGKKKVREMSEQLARMTA